MRGNIGFGIRLPNSNISNARQTLVPFSTFSNSGTGGGGGGGRGRGRGSPLSTPGPFGLSGRAPGKPDYDDSKLDSTESAVPPNSGPSGLGHGRGKPIAPSSGLPSFSSFMSSLKQPPAGRGQVTGPVASQPANDSGPKKPIFFKREEGSNPPGGSASNVSSTGDCEINHKFPDNIMGLMSGVGRGKPMKQPGPEDQVKEENQHLRVQQAPDTTASKTVSKSQPVLDREAASNVSSTGDCEINHKLPDNILGLMSGVGRGKSMKQPGPEDRVKEENRHLRVQQAPDTTASKTVSKSQPVLDREAAMENALKILSQGRGASGGGRGRGRGQGRGRESFTGRGRGERDVQDTEETYATGVFDEADDSGEILAKRIGSEVMNQLVEGFEEMAARVLPSPLEDEYLDALDINCAIEFEPQYLMGEFDRNPDIDEKPPIPLRDALEKMKPFLMAYEGIQSQEEWEEIMEETMARVPLLKKIVDHYSGPDRVTAKKQQEELERVAKTLPQSAPSSVKRFTDRAVLSLQSNPGWGFDKKCQFMDKLVSEVSKHYE